MTLDQLAYNIKRIANHLRGNSDDNFVKIRQVKGWIHARRTEGIAEFSDYGKNIDPQMTQDLGILTLQKVDQADSSCPAVEWGCKILKVDLPKLVTLPKNRSLTFVGLADKRTPINLDDADVSIYKEATMFGRTFHRCYLVGQTLYVKTKESDSTLKYINVRGIFEDPTQVKIFPKAGCTPEDCHVFDDAVDEYPLPLTMYEYVLKKILTLELGFALQTVDDELNNARQDTGKIQP